jgi:Protein of unknown function (DUF2721)
MPLPSISELIPVIQTAIGPMILISGVGLLLLSMTNRLGRVIDRVRILSHGLDSEPEEIQKRKIEQLIILWRRARLIRLAITLTAVSALCAALLIILIFLLALLKLDTPWLMAGLFFICMSSLIGALIAFIKDINQTLAALKLEVRGTGMQII